MMLFDIVTVWSILIIQLLPTCTFMQQASLAITCTTCLILLYSTVLHQKIKLQNFVNFQTSQCLTTLCTFYVFMFDVCISGLEQRHGLLLEKGKENSYKKASTKWQKNTVCTVKDLSSTLQKQNVPQVQYMNISEGWLSSNSSYFLLLGIKSSLPTKFWCTYLSVEDCCCCCCCCCCWMEPDDDRWDSLLEVCLWVLSGLDCCWSKPSGLWRILVIVMPSLPPPIPESFFLEMFCSSGEYSWAVNIRVIVKDFYFTTHSHLMACNTERYIYPC